MPPAKEKTHIPTGRILRTYARFATEYPWLLTFVIGGLVIVQLADLAAPLYLRQFFNTLTLHAPSAAVGTSLLMTLGFVALMWFLDWVGNRISSLANEHLEAHVMETMYSEGFRYLLRHSYNFFASNFAGSLTHKVGKFARSFETFFDAVMTQFFPTALFVTGAIIVLFVRNAALGSILAISALILLVLQIYLSRLRQPVRAERSQAETELTGILSDAVTNQTTISLFSGFAHEESLFGAAVARWRRMTLRSWTTDSWVWAGLNFLMIIIQAVLLGGAVLYWERGALTVGDFVLIQAYLLTTFNRLLSINFQLRRFYDAIADGGEMIAILDTPHEVADSLGAQTLRVAQGQIAFNDVQFYFNETKLVLHNLSLTIAGGEKVALVGPSGAGKSTITRLLLRLYDVIGGAIMIDGQNIGAVTQDSLHEAISFVPQEPILFHRTLRENIKYGKQDATNEEIIDAAKKAHCHEFISSLPLGYDTLVGERGVKLSGGERQRVAIARAILKNAPILVLDEATSSLDSESEHLIQDALAELMQGKTVVVIAHRLSTIMKMDRIVVIDAGAVVASGTHDELLAQGGLYAKLWSIQAGGFLRDEDEPENNVEKTDAVETENFEEEEKE